jgi:voltage-gated potassium channel
MRKRIFEIIEKAEDGDKLSSVYDFFMMVTIILSLLPLTTKSKSPVWSYIYH